MSEKDAGKICLFQQTNSLLKVQIFEILIIAVKLGFSLSISKIEETNWKYH